MKGVYLIRNLVNGKIYVGSSFDIQRRWREHKNRLLRGQHHSANLQAAWLKYGALAFEFEVLEECASADIVIVCEQRWLDALMPYDKVIGYNRRKVAESCLGIKRSGPREEARLAAVAAAMKEPAVRAKIRAAKSVISPETRRKIGDARRGKKMSREAVEQMKARVRNPSPETLAKMSLASASRSAEAKRKIAESLKGRMPSDLARKRASEVNKGRVLSEETKEKMAASKRGKPRDEATKAKLRESALRYYAERRAA